MDFFQEKNGVLYAEDVSLETLAQEFGTPCYVYSANAIRTQQNKLMQVMKGALPANRQPRLCYACKANGHLAVLQVIRQAGGDLEIVSEGEMHRGLAAGFKPSQIVATGVGKTRAEITAYIQTGIYQINVESLPELELIGKIAQEINKNISVAFRFNPDVSGGGHDKISTGRKHDKFGLHQEDIFKAFEMTKALTHVDAVGLSVHIGSQVFDVSVFEKAFAKFPNLVTALRAKGYTISRLDIGGGFPIQYDKESLLDLESYAQWVSDIIAPLDTEILLEPGRYLVGNAGVLLSEILYVKQGERREFVILDAGMNDLMRPALYDAYHGIEPVTNRNAQQKTYDIVGPVCETSDRFGLDRTMAQVTAGDLVVLKSAGAYGFCMASNYNTRPLATEILVDGDRYCELRKRQSIQDLISQEIIPGWLL